MRRLILRFTAVVLAVVTVATVNPTPASGVPGVGSYVLDFAMYEWEYGGPWFVMYVPPGYTTYNNRRYGSGSGNGSYDECLSNQGPLPMGRYSGVSSWHQDSFNGSAIYGRVFRLQNKQCWNGTWRTALFIHTEETPSRTQGSIEPQRWDGPSDYKSAGCVKLARSNNGGDNGIGVLDYWWHYRAGGGVGTPYYNLLNAYWA